MKERWREGGKEEEQEEGSLKRDLCSGEREGEKVSE